MAGDDNDDDKIDLSVSMMACDDNDDDKIDLSGDRVDDVSSRSSCCSTPGACTILCRLRQHLQMMMMTVMTMDAGTVTESKMVTGSSENSLKRMTCNIVT